MRIRHKPWAKEYILSENNLFLNNYIDTKEMESLLNKYDQIRIEVGCGKGQFIYEHAKKNPNILYIGIEKQASILVLAAEKNKDIRLENLKYYYGDINNLVDNNILKNKVNKIFLNFSDPWPKKRHYKRRLTYTTFLNIYYDLLVEDGIIEQKTDNQSLIESSIKSFANDLRWEFIELYLDLHNEDLENIKTEYEEKFSSLGFKIKFLKLKKRGKKL